MKPRLTLTILVLCLFLSAVLTSCSYTNRIWGDWGPWGEWKQQDVTEYRGIIVNSKPEGGHVYLNGTLAGDTPITLSLRCPILKSQRVRTQYANYVPGLVEFILFSRPKTSPVSTEKEERARIGTQTYAVEVRKQGYISSRRNFSVPETSSLDFTLKLKPTLFIRPFKIINNFSLSIAQRLFNSLYGKKFGADTSKLSDFDKRYFFPALMEVFEISPDKHSQYSLEGNIIIGKAATEIGILLIEASGRLVAAKKAFIETKDLDNIHQKIDAVIRSIVETFLNES